jgi:2-dehydro-3-deoxyglucarate aldolase
MRQKLMNNELTIGSWLTIPHPMVVEIMATGGFEWLVVDLEHTSIDMRDVHMLITTIQANQMKAIVRVSKNEEVVIKRVLDIGADGIIVPMVNSRNDAIKAVEYAKYPPEGKRGVGLFRAQRYGIGFEAYKKWLEEELVIIAQIEHIDAVANINDIIDVKGIDGVIIGPYDLSSSMGYPGDYLRDDVSHAIEEVMRVCSANNFPSGFHVIETDPDIVLKRISQGCSILAYSIDFFFLGDSVRSGISSIRMNIQK